MKKYSVLTLLLLAIAVAGAMGANRSSKRDVSANLDVFNSIVKELQTFYVDSIDMEKSVTTAIDAMLAGLDPYTEYIPYNKQEEFAIISTGEYGGIGSFIQQRPNGDVYISQPQEGSPAEKVGLRAGDLIVKVDNDTVLGLGSEAVTARLKGQAGSTFKLTVKRPYATPDSILTFDITRSTIQVASVPYFGVVRDSIGYIQITTFSERTPEEVRNALTELRKDPRVKSILLDLRSNGGGVMESAIQIVGMFVPKGTEVLRTRGKGLLNEKIYKTPSQPIDTDIPLGVLINEGSASASEIVTGALQDLDRAVVIGNRSYGKGLVQTSRQLPFDGLLKLTMAKYYIPSGRLIQAIDYSHRKSDGSVERIPDSLTTEFTTAHGRKVRDGGGITPDSTVTYPEPTRLLYNLVRDNWMFDYATRFVAREPQIDPADDFVVTDSIFADFKQFVDPDKLQYDKMCEVMVEALEEAARNEGYMNDSVKAHIDIIRSMLRHNLDTDFNFNRTQIDEYLGAEIMGHSHGRKGEIIYNLRYDNGIDAAAAILNDPKLYQRILAPVKAGK